MCIDNTAHIDKLPLVNKPDVFGLHPNAEIGYYTMAARNIWNSLIELQPQTGKWPSNFKPPICSRDIPHFTLVITRSFTG
ncbi:hypothetical protein M5D96_000689 [Drosophila gunungcola]|uniref:Uncharacterized protein n=1 Tax=Drosophila gunungcola TaxID=103775 RepID=A0A9P9YX36_9MUSC|nr:hypothetical protein M5D96_000689 [Drosophila gunungcola]